MGAAPVETSIVTGRGIEVTLELRQPGVFNWRKAVLGNGLVQ